MVSMIEIPHFSPTHGGGLMVPVHDVPRYPAPPFNSGVQLVASLLALLMQ
jgi:hypothetical protein